MKGEVPFSPMAVGLAQPRVFSAANGSVEMSPRDRQILVLAHQKLRGRSTNFDDALRALREATEELIPSGRTFLLGSSKLGPIVGSTISGVGIAPAELGVCVVRVFRNQQEVSTLGRFF